MLCERERRRESETERMREKRKVVLVAAFLEASRTQQIPPAGSCHISFATVITTEVLHGYDNNHLCGYYTQF